MLQQGRHCESLDPLLEIRDEIVENPESHVTQYDTVLAQVEIPQALLVLSGRVLDLERLVTGVLLHVVQQTQGVAQPKHSGVEVIAFLQHAFNGIQVFGQQRSHLVVIVNAVGVPDAHEENVGR